MESPGATDNETGVMVVFPLNGIVINGVPDVVFCRISNTPLAAGFGL